MYLSLVNSDAVATLDKDDHGKAIQYSNWFLDGYGYVRSKKDNLALHKFILNIPLKSSICVHHFNRNKLDNRRSNLRKATASLHAKIHKLEREKELREWAKLKGIKNFDNLDPVELQTLKYKMPK